ncbi:cupin domain-containing protein [Nocardia sp. NPDC050175]|uniref:cupin domain-containing protein n=1 Tax=Nocardia sp. NPDC050175 TaxID=3364317 RepID=UPI003790055D
MVYAGPVGVRAPWTQPQVRYYDGGFEQVLSEQETASALSVMRAKVFPAGAPPLHFHTREDEFWVILSGQVRFWIGGYSLTECAVSEAGPGAFVYGPRNIPHTFQTITEESEVLVGSTPGVIEGYFKGVGAAEDRDHGKQVELLGTYGVTIVGPPPVWSDWN